MNTTFSFFFFSFSFKTSTPRVDQATTIQSSVVKMCANRNANVVSCQLVEETETSMRVSDKDRVRPIDHGEKENSGTSSSCARPFLSCSFPLIAHV